MKEFAGLDDLAEGVASFGEKRPPKFAPLDTSFLLLSDPGY
jgi:hypothetical protein